MIRRPPARHDLREGASARFDHPFKVDRERGVIEAVKILGWESDNRRRYLPEAAKKAVGLYEGVRCFCDHPDKPLQSREVADALGVFRNVRPATDGLYADLHFFKAHPMAARVCEDAERGLGVFGMSHNADGVGDRDREGVLTIREITEVRSVDLVTDPATVTNLREGKAVKVKVSAVLRERVLPALKAGRAKRLAKLLEESPPADTLLMEADDAGSAGDHKDHLYSAMRACEGEDDEMAKKIHGLLKPQTAEEEEGDDDGDEPAHAAAASDMESKKAAAPAPGAVTLTEARCRDLCELAGVEAKTDLLKRLTGCQTEREAMLEIRLARGSQPAQRNGNAPRSQGPRPQPVTESRIPQTADEQAALLLK